MAKVTGPLFSVSASGKIANSMVYFGWKGINVVRQWVIPSNPQSAGQGDQRLMVGGTGRAVGKIQPEKAIAAQLIALNLIPSGQTKQSYLVKYIMDTYLTSSFGYTTQLAALTGHTRYAEWGDAADDLTVVEFDLDYASVAAYNKALGLYLIAKAAIALGFTGTPYTLPLANWVTASIDAFSNDFTAV